MMSQFQIFGSLIQSFLQLQNSDFINQENCKKIAKLKLFLREEVLPCISIPQTRENLPHDSHRTQCSKHCCCLPSISLQSCSECLEFSALFFKSLIISTDSFKVCFSGFSIFPAIKAFLCSYAAMVPVPQQYDFLALHLPGTITFLEVLEDPYEDIAAPWECTDHRLRTAASN